MPRKPPKDDTTELSVKNLGALASKKNFDYFIDHSYTNEQNVPHFDFYHGQRKPTPVHVIGSDNSEDVILSAFDDLAEMGDGDDIVAGASGSDTIMGEEGNDYLFGDTDWAIGGSWSFGDLIDGGDGNDLIVGDAPNLYGSAVGGDDTIIGGAGNDDLWGDGALFEDATGGADEFIFNAGSGEDTIHDFEDGKDVLVISGYAGLDEFGDLTIQETNGNTIIDLGVDASGQNEITILGATGLGEEDFIFV